MTRVGTSDASPVPVAVGAADGWDLPAPYVARLVVGPDAIDAYRHVNNAVYVEWLDRAAWEHSAALGLPLERCLEMDRGMAVLRTTIRYLEPALDGDAVEIGTWLLPGDGALRVRRRFQVRRAHDAATLVRAEVEYGCLELATGRPAKPPREFRERYAPRADVVAAAAALPAV